MKGFLRVYEDSKEIVSKLYWGVIRDSFLNFYKDKKSLVPISIINLEGCEVSRVYSEKYQANLIQIKTENKINISLVPDNIKEFENWENCIFQLSSRYSEPKNEKVNSVPRSSVQSLLNSQRSNFINYEEVDARSSPDKYTNINSTIPMVFDSDWYGDEEVAGPADIIESRQRYTKKNSGPNRQIEVSMKPNTSAIEMAEYRRKSSDYSRPRPSTPTNNKSRTYPDSPTNQRHSNLSNHQRTRGIDTVKEDPMMSDDDILETKTIDELRKKYPISDKTKRWSIAATDIVGKSNDELFLMLIQLNREKSHMDIWKETLGSQLNKIDEALKNENSVADKKELQNSREYLMEQLNEMDYMINLAHPLISFLESVVQMSDVYNGDNQTFHVVYHQHQPSGKEDFSNIDFIRHNQEREVARLINENSNQSQSANMHFNSLKNSLRSNSNYGKENHPEIALNLKNSQNFIKRRHELNEVLEDIENQLSELNPLKETVEKFLVGINIDETDAPIKQASVSKPSKTSLKNVKSQKPSDIKMNDFSMLPRRSTRKAPKSDMTASLNRSGKLPGHGTVIPPTANDRQLYGNHSLKIGVKNKIPKSDNEELDNRNKTASIYDHSFPVKQNQSTKDKKVKKDVKNDPQLDFPKGNPHSESRLQNQLMNLVNGTPPYQSGPQKHSNNTEFPDSEDGPLIKLNINRYQNMHRPNRSNPTENNFTDIRDSVSNSDVSFAQTPINQRMNLNELVDNNKNWKNPGKNVLDTYLSNENVDAERKADYLINNLLASPAKLEIKERYRGSISNDSDVDINRTERIRKQVAKESMARYTESEVGFRNERESMLLQNSILAHEASKRSRQL